MPATYAIESPRVQELPAHAPKPAGPCAMTIFGVTGDLSKRLLFPALYNLAQQKLLSEQFAVVGYAASEIEEQPLRDTIAEDLRRVIGPEADEATIR
jgi:glucose-6-phosphate 1-dehydrogenase